MIRSANQHSPDVPVTTTRPVREKGDASGFAALTVAAGRVVEFTLDIIIKRTPQVDLPVAGMGAQAHHRPVRSWHRRPGDDQARGVPASSHAPHDDAPAAATLRGGLRE